MMAQMEALPQDAPCQLLASMLSGYIVCQSFVAVVGEMASATWGQAGFYGLAFFMCEGSRQEEQTQ